MTFRDNDDDTSAGKTTQGGSAPRRGNSIFWALGALVVILAVVIAVLTLPKRHSAAEVGTAPVSSASNAGSTGPAGALAAPAGRSPPPASTTGSAPH